jgi:hypothetical protein
MAFAFSILLYPTPHRRTLRLAVPDGGSAGLTTFRFCAIGWVRSRLSAGGAGVCDRRNGKLLCPPPAFWLKPISVFGLLVLTTFINGSRAFSVPSTLVPLHVDARRYTIPARFWRSSCDDGSIVPGTSHHRVTTIAWPGRVPVADHWVVSSHIDAQQTQKRLRVATR